MFGALVGDEKRNLSWNKLWGDLISQADFQLQSLVDRGLNTGCQRENHILVH